MSTGTGNNKASSIPRPAMTFETAEFWEGVKRHELVFQRCRQCGSWIHPPRPSCPACRSFEKEWAPSSGKGTIYSCVTYRESPSPAYETPYSVVLVQMEEGIKLVSNMIDIKPEEIFIGMPVEVIFDDIAEDLTLPKFKKA